MKLWNIEPVKIKLSFGENGEVALNTEFWSVIILSQFERVASYMGYECEFLNPDFETEGGIVIFRKS